MEEETLFSAGVGRPLADRMRPSSGRIICSDPMRRCGG